MTSAHFVELTSTPTYAAWATPVGEKPEIQRIASVSNGTTPKVPST